MEEGRAKLEIAVESITKPVRSNVDVRAALPKNLVWEKCCTSSEEDCVPPEKEKAHVLIQEIAPGAQTAVAIEKSGQDQTIVGDVEEFIKRFVFLPDESLYLLLACWVIGTHLHQAVEVFGYVFAYSPEPQSGKTTLLDLLDLLVHNSSGVQHAPTEAVLFRTAKGRTQLLDEVDSWKDPEALRSVLNAGYKKGGLVTRCDKDNGMKPTEFAVFAPRALAGIGTTILHQATLDRTFAIAMVRQKKTEKRERFRLRVIGKQAATLKQRIARWAKEQKNTFTTTYEKGQFPYLEGFSDRTGDIAEPLAAVVEVAYEGDRRLVQVRETLVQAIACTRKEQNVSLKEHRVAVKDTCGHRSRRGYLIRAPLVQSNLTRIATVAP